jgi:NDP-sugar pyrophosphorylase family protein
MGKLNQNTKVDVIISCAGTGSRMREVNANVHKALLPFKDLPILWHIINGVPQDKRIGILIGYKAEQIMDFIDLSFPNRGFIFINVEDYESHLSGTAISLMYAREYVHESFWYLPCDGYTYETATIFACKKKSTLFTSPLESVVNPLEFTIVESKNDRLESLVYKKPYKHFKNPAIFTGIMYISGANDFFSILQSAQEREFVNCLQEGIDLVLLSGWSDLGTPDEYRWNLKKLSKYDFSKPSEITYELPNLIIKHLSVIEEVSLKRLKPSVNPNIYPTGIQAKGNFFAYTKIEGSSFYSVADTADFKELLEWLRQHLWIHEEADLYDDAVAFYREKTRSRVENIKKILPYDFNETFFISNKKEINPAEILGKIDWVYITRTTVSTQIHGDLQFDNIICTPEGEFKLIDWRTSFGSQTILGDIYYDLAKLLGGIHMDYFQIKRNNFSFQISKNRIEYNFPSVPTKLVMLKIFEEFCMAHDYDINRIKLLIGIIYLNMSPMHTRPFADLLFFHSLKLLNDWTP